MNKTLLVALFFLVSAGIGFSARVTNSTGATIGNEFNNSSTARSLLTFPYSFTVTNNRAGTVSFTVSRVNQSTGGWFPNSSSPWVGETLTAGQTKTYSGTWNFAAVLNGYSTMNALASLSTTANGYLRVQCNTTPAYDIQIPITVQVTNNLRYTTVNSITSGVGSALSFDIRASDGGDPSPTPTPTPTPPTDFDLIVTGSVRDLNPDNSGEVKLWVDGTPTFSLGTYSAGTTTTLSFSDSITPFKGKLVEIKIGDLVIASANIPASPTADVTIEAVHEFGDSVNTDIDLEGFDSLDYELWVDTDGDGKPDSKVTSGRYNTGEPLNLPLPENGAAWELKAVAGVIDGNKVALNNTLSSGAGSGTATGSVSHVGTGTVGVNTVNPDGTIRPGNVSVGTTTVNGVPKTTYSYADSQGQTQTVAYSGSGTSSATASDIREASSLNSAALEKQTGELVASLGEIRDALNGDASPTPIPSPTPTEEEAAQAAVEKMYGGTDVAPVLDAPGAYSAPDVGGGGGGEFWSVDLGTFGVINFDPTSDGRIIGLAGWIKQFITLLATALFAFAIAKMTWEFQKAISEAPQTIAPAVEASVAGFGGNLSALIGPILGGLIVASIIGGVTIWSTYVGVISPSSGDGAVTAIAGLFNVSGSPSLEAALQLLLFFVPVAHIATLAGNYFLAHVFRGTVYMAYQAIRKMLFGGG